MTKEDEPPMPTTTRRFGVYAEVRPRAGATVWLTVGSEHYIRNTRAYSVAEAREIAIALLQTAEAIEREAQA